MAVKGHNLIWSQQSLDSTPDWVNAINDRTAQRAALADHIKTVVSRYKGRVDRWDVVNEPLETNGSDLYKNHFYQVLGSGYIAHVHWQSRGSNFRRARSRTSAWCRPACTPA